MPRRRGARTRGAHFQNFSKFLIYKELEQDYVSEVKVNSKSSTITLLMGFWDFGVVRLCPCANFFLLRYAVPPFKKIT